MQSELHLKVSIPMSIYSINLEQTPVSVEQLAGAWQGARKVGGSRPPGMLLVGIFMPTRSIIGRPQNGSAYIDRYYQATANHYVSCLYLKAENAQGHFDQTTGCCTGSVGRTIAHYHEMKEVK